MRLFHYWVRRFHALRNTHCTRLLEAGAPIKYLQERLGHKNITVTWMVYNHLTQNQKEQGYNTMVGATVACAVAVEEAMNG